MIPKPITLDGRTGTVLYLDDQWHPTTEELAVAARVLFHDGGTLFLKAVQSVAEKFDPTQLRDEKGRWSKGSSALGQTFLHGTAQAFLTNIIANGLKGEYGGLVHPTDQKGKTLSLPGHVYMTTDLEEAKKYATVTAYTHDPVTPHTVLDPVYVEGIPRDERHAAMYEAGTAIGGDLPCVLTVELPAEVTEKLRKDVRSDVLSPFEGRRKVSKVARSYKGDIKPEWIKSVSYMTRDLATGEETWHVIDPKEWKAPAPTTPPWIQKADGTVFYIPLVIPVRSTVEKFDPNQPRDKGGKWVKGAGGVSYTDMVAYGGAYGSRARWVGLVVDGKEVGHAEYWPEFGEPQRVNLEYLGIDKSVRGHGHGEKFYRHVVEKLKKEGFTMVQGEVTSAAVLRLGTKIMGVPELDNGIREVSYEEALETLEPLAPENAEGVIETDNHLRAFWTLHAKKFDEAKHPRNPKGSEAGGEFTETGQSAARSTPVLAAQAKAGMEAVEKLLPQALEKADFTVAPRTWAAVSPELKAIVRQAFIDREVSSPHGVYSDETTALRTQFEDALHENNQEVRETALHNLKAELDRFKSPVDPDSLTFLGEGKEISTQSFGTTHYSWRVLLDAARKKDGTPLTSGEHQVLQNLWEQEYQKSFRQKLLWLEKTDSAFITKLHELSVKASAASWDTMHPTDQLWFLSGVSEDEQAAVAQKHGLPQPDTSKDAPEGPKQWVTGVQARPNETSTETEEFEENYDKTRILARELTALRMDQIRAERGLDQPVEKPAYTVTFNEYGKNYIIKDANGKIIGGSNTLEQATQNAEEWAQDIVNTKVDTPTVIQRVWTAWKQKSSEGLGLSLQLAAARELNGHHRMTDEEVKQAESDALEYGGIANLQAYVRAQWEVTQYVMKKAGEDKVAVYRGLMLPNEMIRPVEKQYVTAEGKPLDLGSPTITKEGFEPGTQRPFVQFQFAGEKFAVYRERIQPTSILGIPTWAKVKEPIKQQALEVWMADAADAMADEPGITPERKIELAVGMFDRMSDHAKLDLLQKYIERGQMEGTPPHRYETVEEAMQRRIDKYVQDEVRRRENLFIKLPDIVLQRAGAQSTTGTAEVANEWNGVGDLPDDPQRVVLRIEAPPTSVLSLPVYGENKQGEHEAVIMGTRDKWLWDAWMGTAPEFTEVEMARKAERVPLVIDLQAEDRGKPHWMSTVNWATVEKFDESKHPRDKEGQFAHTQQGARAALMGVMEGPVGVDDHPTAIKAAHETAAVLREMKAKGYTMPTEVDIRVQQGRKAPAGEALTRGALLVQVPDHLPPEMSLDDAMAVVYTGEVDGAEYGVRGPIRKFVARKFRDLVIHEMGHLNQRPMPTMKERETPEAAQQFSLELAAVRHDVFGPAAASVSRYATVNPAEFVAETFTALYNGETLPAETLRVYQNLRGADIR